MTFAIVMAMLGISSCSEVNLYDETKVAERDAAIAAAEAEAAVNDYKTNFVNTYGEVDPDQSWDFSSNDEYFVIPSAVAGTRAAMAGTRADEATYTMTKSQNYYEVQQSTLNKMNEVFKEGNDNRSLGKPFAMTVPTNDFTIMPIFMGQSGGDFDLYMHVDGIGEILVWRKWEDMQAKFKGKNGWQDLYTEKTVNTGSWFFPNYVTVRESTTGGKNTVDATAIQSKYFTFHGLPAGANMYFYLKITQEASGYNTKGQALGSVNNYMREYKFGENDLTPTNLPGVEDPEVKIIGCEDASTNKGDNDFNDVVFLLYGDPYVPQSFEVTDLTKVVKKRYMIEDLGESDDTDFNDIVVDVVSTYSFKQTTSTSGITTYSDEKLESRKAEIRALGGTLDVLLNIGGKTWKKSDKFDATKMINTTEPDYNKVLDSFDLPLTFDPATNDVSVTVYQKNSNNVSAQVNFPPNGAIPMIIALDATADWATERTPFDFGKYVTK